MAEWKKIELASMFAGLSPSMLKSLKTALEMSIKSMETQVKSIEKYIEKMIDPLLKLLKAKVKELEEKLKAFDIEIGFHAFDSVSGKDGSSDICNIFDTADFIKEDNLSCGMLLMIKTDIKKIYEDQMKAINNLFNSRDNLNKWDTKKLGFYIPFFNPDNPACTAKKIIEKFEEFLKKLKEKKDAMLDFAKQQLEPHIEDAKIKIEEIEKILKAIKVRGIYQLKFDGVKGKAKLKEDIMKTFEEKEEDDTNVPVFKKNDNANGIVFLLSTDKGSYKKMSGLLKKALKI